MIDKTGCPNLNKVPKRHPDIPLGSTIVSDYIQSKHVVNVSRHFALTPRTGSEKKLCCVLCVHYRLSFLQFIIILPLTWRLDDVNSSCLGYRAYFGNTMHVCMAYDLQVNPTAYLLYGLYQVWKVWSQHFWAKNKQGLVTDIIRIECHMEHKYQCTWNTTSSCK